MQKSWNKLWPDDEGSVAETVNDESLYEEIVAVSSGVFSLDEVEIGEWLQCDESVDCYQLLTDEQIIDMATEAELTTDSDAEFDGDDATDDETVTAKDMRKDAREAAANIEEFIDWYSQQEDANKTDTMMLRRLRGFAVSKSETTTKQTKITEFFF